LTKIMTEPFSALLSIVNRLQDVFQSVQLFDTIDLPQIAVVGSQSSGKSSVLESLVGRGFLPRGSGIVTRCPVILQLISTAGEGNDGAEYAEFLHLPGQKFSDFDVVRNEIERATVRAAGANKGVSPTPINVKIHSPRVLNLTLIDLPGIIKVPVGDQPQNIESLIREMVLRFISRPNCLILAVSPANLDLANSDALQIARQVDPDGSRTLGVITKLDLMDRGTDASEVLRNKVFPLKLGYVGVVCRSQADLESKLSLDQAREHERNFFRNHAVYGEFADRMGTDFLARRLQNLLLHHIRQNLPAVKAKLVQLQAQAQKQMMVLGEPLAGANLRISGGPLVLDAITRFSNSFREMIEGKVSTQEAAQNKLTGGSRISHLFHSMFAPCLSSIDPLDSLTDVEIRSVVRNAKGARSTVFVPESAFEILVRQQIQRLEKPCQQLVDLVLDELTGMQEYCEAQTVSRFPQLKQQIRNAAAELLQSRALPSRQFVSNLISIELAYINTSHPDFRIPAFGMGAMQPPHTLMPPPPPGSAGAGVGGVPQSASMSAIPVVAPGQQMGDGGYAPAAAHGHGGAHGHAHGRARTPPRRDGSGAHSAGGNAHANANAADSFFDRLFFKKASVSGGPQPTSTSRSGGPGGVQGSQNAAGSVDSPAFMGGDEGDNLLLQPVDRDSADPWTQQEIAEVQFIRGMMSSYFAIVRKNIVDAVPKCIMFFMVNYVRDHMQTELVARVYRESDFEDLLREAADVEDKRSRSHRTLLACQHGLQIIHDVRDMRL
jgi:dynamin 1-like protein